jgi:hypothetical protein
VPRSIDATGGTNAAAALQAFVDAAPDGSTIVFQPDGRYRLDQRLWLIGRKGLTLEGNGATFELGPGATHGGGTLIVDKSSEDITIRDLNILGNYSAAGTVDSCCSRESEHGIAVYGSDRTLIENVDIRRVGGDCFYIEPSPADRPPDGVTVRDSGCRRTGRHGIALEGGRDILVENTFFDGIGFDVIDIEPGRGDYNVYGFTFRNNTVGSYGHDGKYNPWFLAVCDAPWNEAGSIVRDVTVTGNTVEGSRSGWSGKMLGLHTLVCDWDNGRRANFTFKDNVATSTVDEGKWGVVAFHDVDGVTVTGNRQPLSGGVFATFPGSTNVTYDE